MDRSREETRSVDVTGLSEEAVGAVRALVATLREQASPRHRWRSHEEWSRAFHEWVDSHRRLDTVADDSRESIYGGRGE